MKLSHRPRSLFDRTRLMFFVAPVVGVAVTAVLGTVACRDGGGRDVDVDLEPANRGRAMFDPGGPLWEPSRPRIPPARRDDPSEPLSEAVLARMELLGPQWESDNVAPQERAFAEALTDYERTLGSRAQSGQRFGLRLVAVSTVGLGPLQAIGAEAVKVRLKSPTFRRLVDANLARTFHSARFVKGDPHTSFAIGPIYDNLLNLVAGSDEGGTALEYKFEIPVMHGRDEEPSPWIFDSFLRQCLSGAVVKVSRSTRLAWERELLNEEQRREWAADLTKSPFFQPIKVLDQQRLAALMELAMFMAFLADTDGPAPRRVVRKIDALHTRLRGSAFFVESERGWFSTLVDRNTRMRAEKVLVELNQDRNQSIAPLAEATLVLTNQPVQGQ